MNDEPGTPIAFPDETFWTNAGIGLNSPRGQIELSSSSLSQTESMFRVSIDNSNTPVNLATRFILRAWWVGYFYLTALYQQRAFPGNQILLNKALYC